MKILTSNFTSLKRLQQSGTVPVAISVGVPRWYKGARMISLAPTRAMLKAPKEDYDRAYAAILAAHDPARVLEELSAFGATVALLCWEARNISCHRRQIAEWLEEHLGMEITEFGMERQCVLPYADMPEHLPARPRKRKKTIPGQAWLF